jgi:hypothetical protein
VSVTEFLILANADEARGRVVIAVGALIAVCLIAGAAILIARRKLLAPDNSASDQGSLLEQLRAMRDRGEMSQAEFDQAKQSMHAKLREGMKEGMLSPKGNRNQGAGKRRV